MALRTRSSFFFIIVLPHMRTFFSPPGDTDTEGKPHGQGFFIHRDKPVKGVNIMKSSFYSGFE
jgi:hypothetical protein